MKKDQCGKILIIDDDSVNRRILSKMLDAQVIEASDGKEGLELARKYSDSISCIMLDIVMPGMNGFEFLEEYSGDEKLKNIPVIVTTGDSDEENEIKALKAGAWDFVTKPYQRDIIGFRVQNAIKRSQLPALLELKYSNDFDSLTGIYNKQKFFEETRIMLDENPDADFAFVRFDIDRFQLINSFFGTDEGNRLLKYIAKQLINFSKLYERSTYCRVEADIFCMCSQFKEQTADKVCQMAREILKSYNLDYDIVPSFGFYVIDDKSLPVETMYDRASLAAKSCKGSYVKYYERYVPSMSDELKREQRIVNEMDAALKDRQFHVYLQPKYNINTNTVAGAEALVRWIHPEKGMISPGEFIPIFERNGFITKLDFYMWEEVCKLLQGRIKSGKKVFPISVNISRVNLYNPNLPEIIKSLAEKYEVPAEYLNLELTESAYTDNPEALKSIMKRLKKYGFQILMDDFGSGYSSLNVLKDIDVDVLKIDMKFLQHSEKPGRGENIIASVVRMAKWLDMPVIAEGVEEERQVSFLQSIGCEYVQGFYFARPMPVKDFAELVNNNTVFVNERGSSNGMDVNAFWNSNPQFETLFSSMMEPTTVIEFSDSVPEILRVNKAFYDAFGYNDTSFLSFYGMNDRDRELLLARL